jgi:ATP-dependent Clp protease ATP-binding subunit ClpB
MKMENRDEITGKAKTEVIALLQKTIRPEFLNRIDETIMFTPLNKDEVRQIVVLQLNNLTKMLQKQNIIFKATEEAIDSLAIKGYNPQYGARPIKRVIQREVLNELSKEILAGSVTADSKILLDALDNRFVFKNQ